MKDELPSSYVQIHINGLRAYAKLSFFEALIKGMEEKKIVRFTDVEGEQNAVNGKDIDLKWISTEETRAIGRAHSKMVDEEGPKEW